MHGAVGEDGSLQGLFEVLDVPYVGSGVLASALAMDKRQARVAFEAARLPIAKGMAFARGRPSTNDAADAAARAIGAIGARLVVKPSTSGSAIGVARFDEANVADVAKAIDAAWSLADAAIVEHFARGREVTCGVYEDENGARAFPPTEVATPNDAFLTYQARYAPGRAKHECPAKLGEALTRRVQSIAIAAHATLGCRDLSRVDFIVGDADGKPGAGDTDGEPGAGDADDRDAITLLEVNTLPGFTATSLYPEAAAVDGLPLVALVDALVRRAHARGATRRNAPLPLPR